CFTNAHIRLNLPLQDSFDSRLPLDLVPYPIRSVKNSFWCATWDEQTSSPSFGHLLKNSPKGAYIQHWVLDTSFNSTTEHRISPLSAPTALVHCPGCHLHEPSLIYSKRTVIDSRLAQVSCLFRQSQNRVVNLRHLRQGLPKYELNERQLLRSSLFILKPQI